MWLLIRRYEGMGWGDVKLLLLIGAMVGPWRTSLYFLGICRACYSCWCTDWINAGERVENGSALWSFFGIGDIDLVIPCRANCCGMA